MKTLVSVLALVAVAVAAPPALSSHPVAGYPNGRIVGGWDAEKGQFPFIVSLQWCILSLCWHSCGGTIIDENWVLTAGHCVTEVDEEIGIGHYTVLAGVLNLDDSNVEREFVRVNQTFVHPGFPGGVAPNDIALFKLSSPLILSSLVQPLALPTEGDDVSGESVLAGWGSTGGIIFPQMPNKLQTVDIPLVNITACDTALTEVLSGGDHPLDVEANICTGPLTGGISACNGDSGGPLIQDDKLIGIVSWGITPCGTTGAPSVYTKVSHYISWISEVLANN